MLVYSDVAAVRDRIKEAIGTKPAADMTVKFVDAANYGECIRTVDATDVSRSYAVHLWAHVWWSLARRDFTTVHGGTLTLDHLRTASSSYARLARRYLPDLDLC